MPDLPYQVALSPLQLDLYKATKRRYVDNDPLQRIHQIVEVLGDHFTLEHQYVSEGLIINKLWELYLLVVQQPHYRTLDYILEQVVEKPNWVGGSPELSVYQNTILVLLSGIALTPVKIVTNYES